MVMDEDLRSSCMGKMMYPTVVFKNQNLKLGTTQLRWPTISRFVAFQFSRYASILFLNQNSLI